MEELRAINNLLAKGMTVTEAEKQLGYSEGKLRKQLSKAGYKFDRKLNQYIPKDEVVTGGNGVTTQKDYKIEQKHLVTRSNGVLQQTEQEQELQQKQVFTTEQIDILYRLINEYQTRQQIQSVAEQDKGKTINRNVRVYEKQFEVFANWCKVNNVTQADALYRAIELLMNNKSH